MIRLARVIFLGVVILASGLACLVFTVQAVAKRLPVWLDAMLAFAALVGLGTGGLLVGMAWKYRHELRQL